MIFVCLHFRASLFMVVVILVKLLFLGYRETGTAVGELQDHDRTDWQSSVLETAQILFWVSWNISYGGNFFSSIASKPINIHWIRTGSQPYLKYHVPIAFKNVEFPINIKKNNLKITVLLFRTIGPSINWFWLLIVKFFSIISAESCL